MIEPPDAGRLLSWSAFRLAFLEPALGADVPVAGEPPIVLFVTPGAQSIGVRIHAPDEPLPDPQLRSVRVGRIADDIVLSTVDRDLFQPFYALLLELSDHVQSSSGPVSAAISTVLQGWRRLLMSMGGLSEEEQIGLSGELWLLRRLVTSLGADPALETWVGPTAQAHDFRLATGEVEVKTTRGTRRRHVISDLAQLEPSPGQDLYVLSLQMGSAGGGPGWTLLDQITELRTAIGSGSAGGRFEQLLAMTGWHDGDAGRYLSRWALRSEPRLVPVDDRCPRLTRPIVETSLRELAPRLSEVRYVVDLDGLGTPEGSSDFNAVIFQEVL